MHACVNEVTVTSPQVNRTALMEACWRGHQPIAELLVTRGADYDLQDNVSSGNVENDMCRAFLNSNLFLDNESDDDDINVKVGYTALHYACAGDHPQVATLLLHRGANHSIRNQVRHNDLPRVVFYVGILFCFQLQKMAEEVCPTLETRTKMKVERNLELRV